MKKDWPMVKLGMILRRSHAPIVVQSDGLYPNFGIYSFGRGLFKKPPISGASTSASTLYRARAGQFVYSRLFAFEGAYGFVSPEFDGYYVSNEFPLFDCAVDLAVPEFIAAYIGQPRVWGGIAESATGVGHRRQRVQPPDLLTYEVPLPPLAEQRRVLARIEELATYVREARTLREKAEHAVEGLLSGTIAARLDEAGWLTMRLGELLAESPRNGLSPQPEVESGGRPMLRINAVSSSPTRFVDVSAAKQVQVSDEAARPFILQHDDVFIVRYNGDINRVAKPAIYKRSSECLAVYPDKLMRLRPVPTKMLPDFLVFALKARSVREQVAALGKTTAGNIGISAANAKSFVVPVPPLPEQHRLTRELDAVQVTVDSLKRLQAQSAAELDALLPAIVDRAFGGLVG